MPVIFQYVNPTSSEIVNVDLEFCPSFPYSEKQKVEQLKVESQDGNVFVRPRFTKRRSKFSLTFDYLTEVDKVQLAEMEIAVNGVASFKYYPTFPDIADIDSVNAADIKSVVLSDSFNFDLEMRTEDGAYWSTSVYIEEI